MGEVAFTFKELLFMFGAWVVFFMVPAWLLAVFIGNTVDKK